MTNRWQTDWNNIFGLQNTKMSKLGIISWAAVVAQLVERSLQTTKIVSRIARTRSSENTYMTS